MKTLDLEGFILGLKNLVHASTLLNLIFYFSIVELYTKMSSVTIPTLGHGKRQDIKDTTNYTSPLKNQIGEKQCVQDLIIMINNTLTFTDHITKVCNTSNQMCGWIQCTFKTRNEETMRTLQNSLVQPHLDYCSQL